MRFLLLLLFPVMVWAQNAPPGYRIADGTECQMIQRPDRMHSDCIPLYAPGMLIPEAPKYDDTLPVADWPNFDGNFFEWNAMMNKAMWASSPGRATLILDKIKAGAAYQQAQDSINDKNRVLQSYRDAAEKNLSMAPAFDINFTQAKYYAWTADMTKRTLNAETFGAKDIADQIRQLHDKGEYQWKEKLHREQFDSDQLVKQFNYERGYGPKPSGNYIPLSEPAPRKVSGDSAIPTKAAPVFGEPVVEIIDTSKLQVTETASMRR